MMLTLGIIIGIGLCLANDKFKLIKKIKGLIGK